MLRRLLLPVILGAGPLAAQESNSGYLAHLLQRHQLGWVAMVTGLAVAFGLGAVHALSPGHGKTIVAAYLVGSRSTPWHAVLLGATVTFTHTVSVFFLGFVTLFLSRFVLPEKIYPVLGAVSGLSIVWVGGTLFYQRLHALRRHRHQVHVHSYVPEGEVTLGSLMALGASGGLVPCPSALVLLLSSVALGKVALGLTLLVAFSLGLAVVLTAIGLAALFAGHLLPDREKASQNAAFRYLPVASAGIITVVGAVMTAAALGWIRVGL